MSDAALFCTLNTLTNHGRDADQDRCFSRFSQYADSLPARHLRKQDQQAAQSPSTSSSESVVSGDEPQFVQATTCSENFPRWRIAVDLVCNIGEIRLTNGSAKSSDLKEFSAHLLERKWLSMNVGVSPLPDHFSCFAAVRESRFTDFSAKHHHILLA